MIEIGNVTFNKELVDKLIKKGFEESGVELEEYDMCQACKDAVAVDRARGYRVCRDCYYEMGV